MLLLGDINTSQNHHTKRRIIYDTPKTRQWKHRKNWLLFPVQCQTHVTRYQITNY